MVLIHPAPAASQESGPPPPVGRGWTRASFCAMGTQCQILFRAPSDKQAASFRDAAIGWVAEFERKYSRFREDSLISEINRQAGRCWVETDEELDSIFSLCDWYHWSTMGAFDPAAMPLIKLWDYHSEHPEAPSEEVIAKARELAGWSKVQKQPGGVFLPEPGMAIDLGGIGKEYAVDRVLEQSKQWGIRDIMVDFGRDIRVAGEGPHRGGWRVGLEHPLDAGRCWAGLLVSERAVTTSGDYLRGFKINGRYYGHIIDPRTGYPVNNGCRAVSVVAYSCTEAGVLSTAALILGKTEGLRLISRSGMAEGCVWQGQDRFETARFQSYVL